MHKHTYPNFFEADELAVNFICGLLPLKFFRLKYLGHLVHKILEHILKSKLEKNMRSIVIRTQKQIHHLTHVLDSFF